MNLSTSLTATASLILAFSILTPIVHSEEAKTPPAPTAGAQHKPGFRAEQMMADLDLTEAQKTQLKPIFEAQRAKISELMKDTTLSREQKAAKMQALRAETEPELKKILTPEQMQKWTAKREQMRKHMQERGPHKKPAEKTAEAPAK